MYMFVCTHMSAIVHVYLCTWMLEVVIEYLPRMFFICGVVCVVCGVCMCVYLCLLYVCIHVCMCMDICVCMSVCGGLKLMLGVFFDFSSLYLLKHGLSAEPRAEGLLVQLANLP